MPRVREAASALRSLMAPRVAAVAVVLLLVALLAVVGNGQPAYAVSIAVDTTDDELNSDGDCSLREAIQAANTDAAVDGCAAGSGADTINVPAGIYTLSIAGMFNENANQTGDLDVTADLTITGVGPGSTIIDGGAIDRVFDLAPGLYGITVEMSWLTIRNGAALSPFNGGGIFAGGTVTLTNVTVSGNTANSTGGGIYNGGTMTITNSTVSANTVYPAGVGGADGGGINNRGTMTITNSTVSANTAVLGGGIFNGGGTVTLTNVTVSGNTASQSGGGLHVRGGTVTLTNSTVTGNTAPNYSGGGIGNDGFYRGTVTLTNSIVANSVSGGDCAGTITSGSHNLDTDGLCGLTGTGDLPSTNPMLGPLADNGGATRTHALLLGSPAIDAGDDTACPATDQRGVTRPKGAACDIGAYELGDTDGDGILDVDDACPLLFGIPEKNGCPPPGPPLAVGGVAGLLDADSGDPAVSDAAGDYTGYAAALVGIVAALTAGGWYARRRWMR